MKRAVIVMLASVFLVHVFAEEAKKPAVDDTKKPAISCSQAVQTVEKWLETNAASNRYVSAATLRTNSESKQLFWLIQIKPYLCYNGVNRIEIDMQGHMIVHYDFAIP